MTLKETLKQLESLGNDKRRAHNIKYGAGDNQFGVPHGDIRVLAKKIKTNHELALALWKTGNLDAQLLATLVINQKNLSADEMDRMVRSVTFVHVADWLTPMSSSSIPTRSHFAKRGWPLTTQWLPAPDGV